MDVVIRDGASGPLYACAGEATFCEKGHYLSRFAHDVHVGDFGKPDDFTDMADGLEWGSKRCPTCGARTVGATGKYFMLSARPQEVLEGRR